jgi:CHAT domain-containing protein
MSARKRLALGILLIVSITLPVAGSRTPVFHRSSSVPQDRSPHLRSLISLGNDAFNAGRIEQAREIYENGLKHSEASKAHYDRVCLLLGLANSYVQLHRYSNALIADFEAEKSASAFGYSDLLSRIAANRAMVYRRMSNTPAEREAMREAIAVIPKNPHPMLLLQAASVEREDLRRSVSLFTTAIERADAVDDLASQAAGWNQLGYVYLQHGRLAESDHAMTEGFRLRTLRARRPAPQSYYYLGLLRLAQKEPDSAIHLITRAIELNAAQRAPIGMLYLYYHRGAAYSAAGQSRLALLDLERALELARVWRSRVVPSESFRVSAEVGIHQIYSAYVRAAMNVFEKEEDASMAFRAFAVAQEQRAVTFRDVTARSAGLDAEYWKSLAEIKAAVVGSLGNADAGSTSKLEALKIKLADIESRLDEQSKNSHQISEITPSDNTLRDLQKKLKSRDALISFHIGKEAAFVWAVTADSVEAHRIPGSADLARTVRQFRDAVQADGADVRPEGRKLYDLLFGGLSPQAVSKTNWILALDGPLFELPVAALTQPDGRFLVEAHSLRLLPDIRLLHGGSETPPAVDRFVGLADAVYNSADPRRKGQPAMESTYQLARLPATAREVKVSAASWGRDQSPVILTGTGVSSEGLRAAMQMKPAVLHVAAHVVQHPASREQVMIALGLRKSGEADFMTPADVTGLEGAAGLVMLSGCGSGSGAAPLGLGLLGLTRAWLVAGAQAVAATYWPVKDEAGRLIPALYAHLTRRDDATLRAEGAAEALRQAQLEMIAAGGRYAQPSYWSPLFVVGKD